jgi:urease accessory protein
MATAGAVLGPPSLWLLPLAFPIVMALGGCLGLLEVAIPGVEIGIAISGLVLGLLVLYEIRAPQALAAAIGSAFALFHGHAHGTELPAGGNPLACACSAGLAPRLAAAGLMMRAWLARHSL